MAAHLRSDMRASAPPPLWGWGDRECDGEGAGQSENMQGDSPQFAQMIVWYFLRWNLIYPQINLIFSQIKLAPEGGWTIFPNCGWTLDAESWMSFLPCHLHHWPPVRTQAWQLGTMPCERGVSQINIWGRPNMWGRTNIWGRPNISLKTIFPTGYPQSAQTAPYWRLGGRSAVPGRAARSKWRRGSSRLTHPARARRKWGLSISVVTSDCHVRLYFQFSELCTMGSIGQLPLLPGWFSPGQPLGKPGGSHRYDWGR